jgi:hypothetical protein
VTSLGDRGLNGAGAGGSGHAGDAMTAGLAKYPTGSGIIGEDRRESLGEMVPSDDTVDWENFLRLSGAKRP